jgi:hypothetical protein
LPELPPKIAVLLAVLLALHLLVWQPVLLLAALGNVSTIVANWQKISGLWILVVTTGGLTPAGNAKFPSGVFLFLRLQGAILPSAALVTAPVTMLLAVVPSGVATWYQISGKRMLIVWTGGLTPVGNAKFPTGVNLFLMVQGAILPSAALEPAISA